MITNHPLSTPRRTIALIALATAFALSRIAGVSVSGPDQREWRDYAGGPDSSRFVAATQITRGNVNQLAVAWTYPAGQTDFNCDDFGPSYPGSGARAIDSFANRSRGNRYTDSQRIGRARMAFSQDVVVLIH